MTKEDTLKRLENLHVDDLVKVYLELLGYGYIHEQLIKYVEQGYGQGVLEVNKVIDYVERNK